MSLPQSLSVYRGRDFLLISEFANPRYLASQLASRISHLSVLVPGLQVATTHLALCGFWESKLWSLPLHSSVFSTVVFPAGWLLLTPYLTCSTSRPRKPVLSLPSRRRRHRHGDLLNLPEVGSLSQDPSDSIQNDPILLEACILSSGP